MAEPGRTYAQSVWLQVSIFFFSSLLAVLVLHCCLQAFSSCGKQGLIVGRTQLLTDMASPADTWTLECTGFSSCGLQAQQLEPVGSRVQAQYLWHMGLLAPCHVDLPGPGMKPMSCSLAVGFLTTGPPRSPRPPIYCFKIFKSQEHGRNFMMNTYTPSPGSSAVSVFPYFLHQYNLYFAQLFVSCRNVY